MNFSGKRPAPLGFLVSLIAFVAILHLAGLHFQFYWRITWYDHVVHFLGAFWVGLTVAFYVHSRFTVRRSTLCSIAFVVTILAGIAWEIFEVKSGITFISDRGYAADTIGDIVSDTVGAIAVLWYVAASSRFNLIQPNQ